ncbi:MAG: LacI family DNA-binding transcriptional regulator [Aquisalinus sp.]|nr:LacI family DNA-binding transcriptional regulator [Aquisalinus sp.]
MPELPNGKAAAAATIVDVAQLAGVSIKTVSRVINNEVSVRPATRAKVLDAIERLGYKRNLFARSLRADKSFAFGLLYENPQGDYSADILHGALSACQEAGYHLVVEILSDDNLSKQVEKFLATTKVDGVFLTPPVCDDEEIIKVLDRTATPFVRLSPLNPAEHEAYVAINDFEAAREITSYLISIGHQRIGHIAGAANHLSALERHRGYRKALDDAQIYYDDALVVSGHFDFDSGRLAAKKLFGLVSPPTAIFAANDEMAAGVLATAHELEIQIPHKCSLVGFDGGTISEVVWPRLTTINQSVRGLGVGAIKLLIDIIENPEIEREPLFLPYEMKFGSSTSSPEVG